MATRESAGAKVGDATVESSTQDVAEPGPATATAHRRASGTPREDAANSGLTGSLKHLLFDKGERAVDADKQEAVSTRSEYAFKKGLRYKHDKHGPGQIIAVTPMTDLVNPGMVEILFDSGETHRYRGGSQYKLKPIVEDLNKFTPETLFAMVDTDSSGTLGLEEFKTLHEMIINDERKRAEEKGKLTELALKHKEHAQFLKRVVIAFTVFIVFLLACMAGLIVGVVAAFKDTESSGTYFSDRSGHVLQTTDAVVGLPMIAAPILPLTQLHSIERLVVSFKDPAYNNAEVSVVENVVSIVSVNNTAVVFKMEGHKVDTVRVWNGNAFAVLPDGSVTTLCTADVECSALMTNDAENAQAFIDEAVAALDAAGFNGTAALARRRMASEVCENCIMARKQIAEAEAAAKAAATAAIRGGGDYAGYRRRMDEVDEYDESRCDYACPAGTCDGPEDQEKDACWECALCHSTLQANAAEDAMVRAASEPARLYCEAYVELLNDMINDIINCPEMSGVNGASVPSQVIGRHFVLCIEGYGVVPEYTPEATDSYDHTPETAVRRRLSQRDPDALFTRVHRPRFAALHRELNEKGDGARTVDLVVARHSEDASWLLDVERELPMVRIFVYEKGPGESACALLDLKAAHCIPLANVGREAHTYLTHLIEHHDDLGAKVVFAQGGAPGYGFQPGEEGGHLMPGSDFFYDYLSPHTPPKVVFTLAYANLQEREVLMARAGYPYPFEGKPAQIPDKMPTEAPASCEGEWIIVHDHAINDKTGHFWDALHARVPEVDLSPDQVAYWKAHLEEELGPLNDAYAPFANGAVLSASGAKLAAHPKAFYDKLRRTVSASDTPDAIFFTELLWAYITGHAESAHACSKQIAGDVDSDGL